MEYIILWKKWFETIKRKKKKLVCNMNEKNLKRKGV